MPKSNPLISVIIPVYNVGKYLGKCLDSVINQTYRNLEIIIINDGSTDNSLEVATKYKNKDNRITLITQENKGLSGARNTGLDLASGDYIFFIDSDDYIKLNTLELFLNKLKENDYKMVISRHGHVIKGEVHPNTKSYANFYSAIDCQKMLNNCDTVFVTVWNKLYKKDAFNTLRFSQGKINEDEAIMHHLYGLNGTIGFVDDNTYFTLHRDDSIMYSSTAKRFFDGYYHAFLDRYEYYKANGQSELIKLALKRLYGCAYDYLLRTDSISKEEKKWIINCIKILLCNFNSRGIKLAIKYIVCIIKL